MATTAAGGEKRKKSVIGTHSGTFHCDEALGCYLVRAVVLAVLWRWCCCCGRGGAVAAMPVLVVAIDARPPRAASHALSHARPERAP